MSAQDDQLASAGYEVRYLLRLDFRSGTLRLCTWPHAVAWDGYSWGATGRVLQLSAVSESASLQYPSLDVSMSLNDPLHLHLAIGSTGDFRRRPISIWADVLDDQHRRVGTPRLHWAGLMDQLRLKTGDGQSSQPEVTLRCEQPGRDGRGAASLRLNSAQHMARHPGDTGLSRIEALSASPPVWLSKRFQTQE